MFTSFFSFQSTAQRVVITFGNKPNAAPSLALAPLKYDKDFVYSLTFDDSQNDAYAIGMPVLNGGYVAKNNTNYPGLFFTDGCGNSLPFRAGIAWNTANVLGIDVHVGNAPSNLSWQQLDTLYDLNWDVFNHSFDHKSALESVLTDQDYRDEIDKNATTIRAGTKKHIETPLFVIPSGDAKYAAFAFQKGYKAIFNQTGDVIGLGGLNVDVPVTFDRVIFRSLLYEGINQVNPIDEVVKKSVNGAHYWFNEFNHRVDDFFGTNKELTFATFESHLKYIAGRWGKNGSDQMWMAPLQEVSEYFYMRQGLKYSVSYDQNKMIIDFDMTSVPTWFRRNHITLKIGGDADISTVSVQRGLNFTVRPKGNNKIINLDFGSVRTIIPSDLPTSDTVRYYLATCFPDSVGTITKKFTNRFGLDSTVFISTVYQSPKILSIAQSGYVLSVPDAKKYQWYKNDTLILNAMQNKYTIRTTGSYRVQTVDSTGCSIQSEVVFIRYFDCISAQKNIGDACDDGDFNTINDRFRSDCTCRGDSTPKTISLKCPNDTTVLIKIGKTSARVSWETPVAASQCLADSISCAKPSTGSFRFLGRVGKSFYYLSNDLKMWTDAQNICTTAGGKLAVIKNETVNNFLTSVIKFTDAVFIGLSADSRNSFKWTDGSSISFSNWDIKEPNLINNFAVLTGWSAGKWMTVNSNVAHYFILEIECSSVQDIVYQTAGLVSGSSFPLGVQSVSYAATNKCSNRSDCRFNVNVDYFKIDPKNLLPVSQISNPILPKFLANVTSALSNNTSTITCTIYPNPSEGVFNLNVSSTVNSECHLSILTGIGSIISTEKYFINIGENKLPIDLSNFSDGLYFLNFVSENQVINTFRLIKQ